MAEIPSNPMPFEVLEDETAPPRVGVEVVAYSYDDPFTVLDVVPRRTAPSFLDEIGGPGGGSFQIFRSDDKLVETPTLLDYRNVFKCVLDGQVVGAFINTAKNSDYINPNERSGEFWSLAGEGLRGWFHDAVVEPYGGVRTDSYSSRVFSFASEQGSWYKPADWLTPKIIQKHNLDPNPGPFGTAPAEWPDAPDANWIWGTTDTAPAPEGINYFRYEFDITGLSAPASYSMFASGKDVFDVYIDGQLAIEAREDASYAKTWRADVELTNGHHIIAARVQSKGTGAAAFIGAFFKAGDATAGTAATLLNVTDAATWKVNPYPDPAPGWTPGEIMLTLLAEAEGRGVRFPTWLSPTFTAEADSEGAAWSRSLDWSFELGTEYFDVIEKLEELVCDVWVNPANYELNMYAERGTHRDTQSEIVQPVSFEVARNVVRASSEGTSEIKNSLLLNTSDGWMQIADSTSGSIAKYGRIEGYVSTGASASVSGDVAQRVFKSKAQPLIAATYDIIDVDDARPFVDTFVGDWVRAPREDDEFTLTTRRIMSISVGEDSETGTPTFAVEFDTIAQDMARRFDRWLKTTSDGTLGGTLSNVSGGGGGGGGATPNGQVTSGPQGAMGPRGLPGFYYKGVWSSTDVYDVSDSVSLDGKFWVAKATTSGKPGVSADWDELIVAPTTTPSIGCSLFLTGNFNIPAASTVIPWTGENYKANITHAANGATVTITDPGLYLISAEILVSTSTAGQDRQFQLQLNGNTIANVRAKPTSASGTVLVAEFPAFSFPLVVGDVLQITSTGTTTHSLTPGNGTWFSVAKVTGARGEQGIDGPGIKPKTTWASGTSYAKLDLVSNNGSSYVCTVGHVASNATEPAVGANWASYWVLSAAKGDLGPTGPGLIIKGVLPDTSSLPATGSPGDGYVVNGYLWIWSTVSSSWEDTGRFTAASRQTISLSAVTGEGTITAASDFRIIWLQASGACRVRFYRTAADRSADQTRPSTAPPQIGGVVLGEFRWEGPAKYWTTGYVISLEPGDTTVYYRIDDGTVDLNICWLSE